MKLPPYVVFDGIDGCGKSTLLGHVQGLLNKAGTPVVTYSFPSRRSPVGSLIRDVLEKRQTVDKHAMMWLFVAEAVDMEPIIQRDRQAGFTVLCDRHTLASGFVYQRALHGDTAYANVTQAAPLTVPDCIYVLDVPSDVALARRQARNVARVELYEPAELEGIQRQRQAYRRFAGLFSLTSTAKLLDATRPLEDLAQEVVSDISGLRDA